jgi:hypothetical protein
MRKWFGRLALSVMCMLPLHAFAGVPLDIVKSKGKRGIFTPKYITTLIGKQ